MSTNTDYRAPQSSGWSTSGSSSASSLTLDGNLCGSDRQTLGLLNGYLSGSSQGQQLIAQVNSSGLWSADHQYACYNNGSVSDAWLNTGAGVNGEQKSALDHLSAQLSQSAEGRAIIADINRGDLWNPTAGGNAQAGAAQGSGNALGTGGSTYASGTGGSTYASGTGGSTYASGTGGSTYASGTGGSTSASNSASGTSGGSSDYSTSDLKNDLRTVLQHHDNSEGGALGDPSKVGEWSDDKIQSLYNGIVAAHREFYPNVDLRNYAHMMVAEGAQESTGDLYRNDGFSQGFFQTTPSTVIRDYRTYGSPVKGADGSTLLDPNGSIDPNNPGQSAALWGWYTRNAVSSGESASEAASGLHDGSVTHDLGNALVAWLTGPKSDRHDLHGGTDAANRFPFYSDRIRDYYVAAGFGSGSDFDNLLNTGVGGATVGLK